VCHWVGQCLRLPFATEANTMSRKHLVIAAVTAALTVTAILAQPPPDGRQTVAQLFPGIGYFPNQLPKTAVLAFEEAQADLKMTEAQKEQYRSIRDKSREKIQQAMQELRKRKDAVSKNEAIAARDAFITEAQKTIEADLTPAQRERLDQIHLQIQNAGAFERPEIQTRLELSKEQAEQMKVIADKANLEMAKASEVAVTLKPKDENSPLTLDEVRAYVKTPGFTELVNASRQRVREARSAMMDRVSHVLNERQNAAYRMMLGAPFEVPTFGAPTDQVEMLTRRVGAALGLLGGQRADPNFDVKVAKPAFKESHPRLLLDEAHHNFHTAGGRYKPFAQIATNDGYHVVPNLAKFSKDVLKDRDILVIANALGAESMGDPAAQNPAFTDIECEVLRQWVDGGGSLLLITDHAPMGSAALSLAKKFGIEMSTGATFDPANSAEDRPASLMFTRANKLLADHPITRGRDQSEQVARVRTFTGQSLKGPPGSIPIMKLADTAVDRLDEKEVSAAGRSQGLAFTYGNGRVVVLGEAAMLSAQVAGDGTFKMGMNAGGIDNKQFTLNILHWLSRLLDPPATQQKKAA
jgi:hypothetical protein